MSGNKLKAQFETDRETSGRISMPATRVAAEFHPDFYFDDSLVVIQVESTLFRVHKFQLIKSDTFSDMFKMPRGPAKELEEGASPEHPIVLSGVKASDFEALLKVLYTFLCTDEKPNLEPGIIVPAFRLAHMWNFAHLRAYLLPLVKDSLNCVDKIVLARELGIKDWLIPAHAELCQRTEPLTIEEGTKLGVHSIIMINRFREEYLLSRLVPSVTEAHCGPCLIRGRFGEDGVTNCPKCGASTGASYRLPVQSPGTPPPSSNERLETGIKKWFEGGCGTE